MTTNEALPAETDVTQADRDAADAAIKGLKHEFLVARMAVEGTRNLLAYAFSRHRIAATPPPEPVDLGADAERGAVAKRLRSARDAMLDGRIPRYGQILVAAEEMERAAEFLATPPASVDATVERCGNGYQLAFYELAKIMDIGARPHAPGHVWRQEMLPRLLRAFPATPSTSNLDGEAET